MNNAEEVKKWLNRAFYADKKVNALKELVLQCRERAESVSVCCERNDRSRSGSAENGTEKALARFIDMERKLEHEIYKQLHITDEIFSVISLLNDGDLEAVLIHRFILFHTIEETAELMHYSPRTVRDKQRTAIEKLCLLLPCFA